MKTTHTRIIPRDLFNEAKLLKCMGRLTLLIHDEEITKDLKFDYEGEPFKVILLETGHLTIQNIRFHINKKPLLFKTVYNAQANYPFYLEYDRGDYRVFDEEGNLTDDFLEITDQIQELSIAP